MTRRKNMALSVLECLGFEGGFLERACPEGSFSASTRMGMLWLEGSAVEVVEVEGMLSLSSWRVESLTWLDLNFSRWCSKKKHEIKPMSARKR